MPGVGGFRAGSRKADGAAVGGRGGLAIDRFGYRKDSGRGPVENTALVVLPTGRNAQCAEHGVIELFGFFEIVGADHDVAEHINHS